MQWFKSLSEPMRIALITGLFAIIAAIVGSIIAGIFALANKTSSQATISPIVTSQTTATHTTVSLPTVTLTPTATVQPTPTVQPTTTQPPAIKPGDILYTADFTHKLSDWTYDPSQWFTSNGILIGKGGGQATLNYPMPTENYKVIATVIISNTSVAGTNSYFGVVARYQSSSVGDAILFSDVTNSYVGVSTCPNNSCAGQADRLYSGIPTSQTIQMQITCVDANITVSAVGHTISYVDMQNPPAAGSVVIVNDGMSVEILSLQVIAT